MDTTIYIANKGDFLVNETYHFEIGCKNKSFKQIKDILQSYIVTDDIEIGHGNKITLWLFVLEVSIFKLKKVSLRVFSEIV